MISSTYIFNPTLIEIPRNLSKKTDNVLAENYHLKFLFFPTVHYPNPSLFID